jgi:predicted NBD/HSP70 family sugar kinase
VPISPDKAKSRLLTPTSIGHTNRARVLEMLHQEGPSSRAQIARALNVNRATVATILQPLIDNGTLLEGERIPASKAGGKPARPLWFSRNETELGSMRIAPNEITVARLGIDGSIHASLHKQIRMDEHLDTISSTIMSLAHACFDEKTLMGIGVAASGLIDADAGMIISVHLAPSLNHYPIGRMLAAEFHVPVTVDHHPRVQALGDKWFGYGRRVSHFASVYTGEALGFGIVHDGAIVQGEAGAGGESGHTVVDMNGETCLCGRTGCWETVATLAWLRREATNRELPGATTINCAILTSLAEEGDRAARELLDRYAHNLAVGMANNEQILASGTYIMHGDVCSGGEQMRSHLERWLEEFSPTRGKPPAVIFADDPDNMTLLGGGGLVLSRTLITIA